MVQCLSKPDQTRSNGVSDVVAPFLGPAPDHIMVFDAKDVVDISVPNVSPADVTSKVSNSMQDSLGIYAFTLFVKLTFL